jgi:hypothetical protein
MHFLKKRVNLALQVPLFERTINTELQHSARGKRLPACFHDLLPTAVVLVHLGKQYNAQNRCLEIAKDAAEEVLPFEPKPEHTDERTADLATSANFSHAIHLTLT